MACATCEHCHSPVSFGQEAIREGFSYHKDCHKCYVCSETNLHNAEVFKGVIFCGACAHRIFQGCASARKTKQQVSRSKHSRSRSKSHRRRERSRPPERGLDKNMNGVIELAQLAGSTSSSCNDIAKKQKAKQKEIITELALQVGKPPFEATDSMKRGSVDMGTVTLVTQVVLKMMSDIVAASKLNEHKSLSDKRFAEVMPRGLSPIRRRKRKKDITPPRNNKQICSDLRIAELGASTEIANMALRKKSEVPIIIKSDSKRAKESSETCSSINHDISDRSREDKQCLQTDSYNQSHRDFLDIRVGSIMKIPFRFFKRNILTRSSLISVLLSGSPDRRIPLCKRFKMIFSDEIAQHRARGVKRLYSSINRRKCPYRMGWLHLVTNMSKVILEECSHNPQNKTKPRKICKHFNMSHSYRCMRAQAMRLAGPTHSQLATMRRKITPKLVRNVAKAVYNNEEHKNKRESNMQTLYKRKPKKQNKWIHYGKTYVNLWTMAL